jgi:translation initiation factor 1
MIQILIIIRMTTSDLKSELDIDDPILNFPIHIRLQPRSGSKYLTTIEGIPNDFNYPTLLKDMKKQFYCNGFLAKDSNYRITIILTGDMRLAAKQYLLNKGISDDDHITIHGY